MLMTPNFLEDHYFKWRESDDPMAKEEAAPYLYGIVNEVPDSVVARLEAAYQEWVKAGKPEY